jgi:hypothetical protein
VQKADRSPAVGFLFLFSGVYPCSRGNMGRAFLVPYAAHILHPREGDNPMRKSILAALAAFFARPTQTGAKRDDDLSWA